jgi:preprotein translocase subunit SecG
VDTILLVVHVLLSLAIIGLVLLQRGKGAEAGAALGGGGGGASGSVFGAQGASNFLSRTTAILAAGFFISSLTLAYMASSNHAPSSLTEESVITESVQPSALDDVPMAEDAVPATDQSDIPAAD